MSREFVADPVVPVELVLGSGRCFTLYRPGWHAVEEAAPFPGGDRQVFVFNSLTNLAAYVERSGEFSEARGWSTDDYTERLCDYPLVIVPESIGTGSGDEQLALGSTLALVLDLLDQLEVDDPHADALRDSPDVERLASGEVAGQSDAGAAARLRELLAAHWAPCVEAISREVVVPDLASLPKASGAGPGAAPDGILLDEVASALTLWFGLSDRGVYTLRTTEVDNGNPTYAAAAHADQNYLAAWSSLEQLQHDLANGKVDFDEPTMAGLEGLDLDLTPDDEDIFDLVEIEGTIGPRLSVEEADTLVTAWTEIVRLAGWGGWSDLLEKALPPATLGKFIIGCAIDRAQDRLGAEHALATADVHVVRTEWRALVSALEAHVSTQP